MSSVTYGGGEVGNGGAAATGAGPAEHELLRAVGSEIRDVRTMSMRCDGRQHAGGEAGDAVSAARDLYADEGAREAVILPVFTLVLWLVCAGVGVAGLVLRYGRPGSYVNAAVVPAGFVKVELPKEEARPVEEVTPKLSVMSAEAAAAPAAPEKLELPAAPEPVAVAAPGAAVAFAVPVEGLVRLVDPEVAAHGRPVGGARACAAGWLGERGRGRQAGRSRRRKRRRGLCRRRCGI